MLACYGSNAYTDIAVPFRALLFNSFSLRFFLVYDLSPADRHVALDGLTTLLAGDRLRHTIGARYKLDDIALAHEAVEGGKLIGNVVVELS
jgi:NADPH:quinone reductase